MENVIFEFEVVGAAKAHVGKVLACHVSRIVDLAATVAHGYTFYNGIRYHTCLAENKHGHVEATLDGTNKRSKLFFKSVKIL